MGDSDEEFDRRRARDKFRGERNEYERPRGREQWDDRGAGRREWDQMGGGNRRERTYSDHHRGYDRGRRDRYGSPGRHEMSPPQMKRMRRDWDDSYGQGGGGGGYSEGWAGNTQHHAWAPDSGGGHSHYNRGGEPEYPTQPPMMPFKHFLSQQEDTITDEDAIKRYNEYKLDFKKAQISEFFLAHKDEEWFKAKYHPEECGKRFEELRSALVNRADVFSKLMAMGYMDKTALDLDKCDDLIKLLDAAVILMEGGTEFDLRVLENPVHGASNSRPSESDDNNRSRNNSESQPPPDTQKPEKMDDEKVRMQEDDEDKPKVDNGETGEAEATAENDPDMAAEKTEQDSAVTPSNKGKKRKREKSERSDSESGSTTDSSISSDSEDDSPDKKREKEKKEDGEVTGEPGELGNEAAAKEERSKEEKERDAARFDNDEPRPKALHRTCSIFLRNLAPTITKQEVEAMCKRYPGFMRVALQDPQPERRFLRRGWVTFERTVNIKDICWNLNNIRLRECEMGAIVNRELKQRVRPVNGVTNYKQVIKADVKLAAKIVQNLDKKWCLWEDKDAEKSDNSKEMMSIGLQSRNPVLKNITDYLVEEGDYEEEELLGMTPKEEEKDSNAEVPLERDEELTKVIQVLDRMILYLRIVHSFDFYSAVEYPNEDEMPHRCGIIHARGPPPPIKMTQAEVNDYLSSFEQKVNGFINLKDKLDREEAVKMGLKDPDAEVEKFVSANTQELGKDKWLCPLSGKKFKGPAFVRKHIFNKHVEKIEEVKKEVAFFNNFLLDPKRPSLSEHPGNRPQSGSSGVPPPMRQDSGSQHSGYTSNQGGGRGGYHENSYQRGGAMGGGGGGGYQGGYSGSQGRGYSDRGEQRSRERYQQNPRNMRDGRRGGDPRSIIEYRDLDAPEDIDIF